jgi:hypothetical protein
MHSSRSDFGILKAIGFIVSEAKAPPFACLQKYSTNNKYLLCKRLNFKIFECFLLLSRKSGKLGKRWLVQKVYD